jgi:hypothetical protein
MEDGTMISGLTLAEDRAHLEAQHLVCLHLVRACRRAISAVALAEESDPGIRRRVIEVLQMIRQDWLEAQKAVARELHRDPELIHSQAAKARSGTRKASSPV